MSSAAPPPPLSHLALPRALVPLLRRQLCIHDGVVGIRVLLPNAVLQTQCATAQFCCVLAHSQGNRVSVLVR